MAHCGSFVGINKKNPQRGKNRVVVALLGAALLFLPSQGKAEGFIIDQNDGGVMLTNQVNHIPKSVRNKVVRQHRHKMQAQKKALPVHLTLNLISQDGF